MALASQSNMGGFVLKERGTCAPLEGQSTWRGVDWHGPAGLSAVHSDTQALAGLI